MIATKSRMAESNLPPIAERLRLARTAAGLTQEELAKRVGMRGQTGIGEIELGRSVRPRRIREIARVLGRSEDWLLGEVPIDSEGDVARPAPPQPAPTTRPPSNAGAPVEATLPHASPVPIYGQAEGGADGRFVLNGEELAMAFRPPSLVGVKHAYAVFVHGSSMEERFRSGDLVWVDPNRPVRQGDDVVVQIRPSTVGDVPFGYVKRFVSRSDKELVLRQLNPPEGADETIRFPGSQVLSVHKVVFVEPG